MRYFEIAERSEIIQKMNDVMTEIENKFECFVEKYREFVNGSITNDELIEFIKNKVYELNEEELVEYNYMNKFLSTKNCDWMLYKVGEIVHNEIIRKWYPDDSKWMV